MRAGMGWRVLALVLLIYAVSSAHASPAPSVADAWFASTRCDELATSDACRNYERCKATHRCARGDEDYTIKHVRHESFTRQYAGGNRTPIALMNDFEDWKSGTLGWKMQQTVPSHSSRAFGWDTFDFTVIGSLELADGYLVFDTDKALVWGDVSLQGVLTETRAGTKVAVFNFMTVYLAKDVRIRFQGSNAVSILSRSSMIIDTELRLRPGSLGGFPGGGFIGTGTRNNNQNGPGSHSTRVYVKTLSTYGTHVPEVQEIQTSAAPGQKIQGYFVVHYGGTGLKTQRISYDASAYDVQKYLEGAFPDIGELQVERDDASEQVPEIGRLWRVTFLTAVGNVPQLRATSFLTGLSSQVETRTVVEGNELSGSFRLQFLGQQTRSLAHDITAEGLRRHLLEDFPFLIDARVERTDGGSGCLQGSTIPDQSATSTVQGGPTDELFRPSEWLLPSTLLTEAVDSVKNVPDKLCSGGRGAANGFVWKLQFWTTEGNVVATSPTSPVFQQTEAAASLTADASGLLGTGAMIEIVNSQCFSVAFGGAGASFAERGGSGYVSPFRIPDDFARVYSADTIPDLVGGSGGSGGGQEPIDVFPVVRPTLGGAGGGAILLGAVNDVLIGTNGKVTANGGNGGMGFTAGGGGSAGSIVIECGGTVSHHGIIEALGGHGGSSTPSNNARTAMPGGGGSGGRIAVYAQSFSTWRSGVILAGGGASENPLRVGGRGSMRVQVHTSLNYRVDPSIGAAGTAKSLLVTGSEDYIVGSEGVLHEHSHQVVRNGPRFTLTTPSKPERISYFVRYDRFFEGSVIDNRGVVFGIHGLTTTGAPNDNKNEFMIAVGITNGVLSHEANAFNLPRRGFQDKIRRDRWYKIDIFLNWYRNTYSIQLNDVLKVSDAPFDGTSVDSISLNNYHAMSTWWDEIYVGDNFIKDFKCPRFTPTAGAVNGEGNGVLAVGKRTLRKLWSLSSHGPPTTYHPMIKHESHVSEREVYQHDNGGLSPFDGAPHREFFNDVREVESETWDGTAEEEISAGEEIVAQAELLTLRDMPQDGSIVILLETGVDYRALSADDLNAAKTIASHGPTTYWYSEIYNDTTGFGAIGACSTLDYLEWRNEGVMLHFSNLTDPFGFAPSILLADRPKVLFNAVSQQFVMWMHVDNASNTMGLSGIAVSLFPNGPFEFARSFYPDAPLESPGGQSINETHDQTIAVIASADPLKADPAYLIRSYFKTVEYWLPRPVMDPMWESVHDAEGNTDFGLSYHRAFYHEGYDDPNDIFLQRWRMEDLPWEVICCEPTNPSNCTSFTEIPNDPAMICPDGMEKTSIIGQSEMSEGSHARTRYKDPNDDANNYFIPHSVRSHTSWGAQVYNIKTWRGNYFDALSTNITQFIFHRIAGERRRREIEADPSIQFAYPNEEEQRDTISTNDTEIVDLLLGRLGVPISIAFRAKYSTYDLAELDFNDDGKVTADEIAALASKKGSGKLSTQLVGSLMSDFEAMKWGQVALLDRNGDGQITYDEFDQWVGSDPNLMFDRFDIDKSGYLDENELARLLWYRQVPRLDTVMIMLDPSFDGRVYYPRFRKQLKAAPDYMFSAYDFDSSSTLTQNEIDLMVKDLGEFANENVLESLKDPTTASIKKADYIAWLSATTSLLGNARNKLKVDNAVHPTRPDSLSGPMHVVERRRAKYVAISRLSSDYLSTEGLLSEVEGDFEGREALLNYFSFAQDLFGLSDDDIQVAIPEGDRGGTQPFRQFLSSEMLGDRASYWNGRHWEGRPSAPSLFTYGQQCLQYAGVGVQDPGCMPCLTRSPFVTPAMELYQSQARSTAHCQSYKELDAYIKAFDQQVSIQLQYQQQSVFGPQGLQPHMSPCFNQSQFFPCDVHKVLDGNVADGLRDMDTRSTQWHLAWEHHPDNVASSQKIRASGEQPISQGPSFIERFPHRDRQPIHEQQIDVDATLAPDQMLDILGGGS